MRILWPRPERKVYYFAFGANLCQTVLDRRKIKVFDAFDYVLNNAELRFSQPGFYKDQGYASADAAAGKQVFGKMYQILKRDAARMDHFEGVPYLKAHEKVFCEPDGLAFYYYRALKRVGGLKPTQEYLDYITSAYENMAIVPDDFLKSLAETQVLETFVQQDQAGTFVEYIEHWPVFMRPLLIYYEGICLRTVEFFWNRSLLHWMIRV